MQAEFLIAESRSEAAAAALWATVIARFPGCNGAWLACDSREALDFALANRHKTVFGGPRNNGFRGNGL